MSMNKDILKGKWWEIKGSVKEKWGKLTDNDFVQIEGKGEKLLGVLQKQYGYMSDKAEPEYKDTVEMAGIVSRIRDIISKNTNVTAITFIARCGQLLSAKKQEGHIAGKDEKQGQYTDRYFDSHLPLLENLTRKLGWLI